MKSIELVTAALNDDQGLNQKAVLELFVDLFLHKEPAELTTDFIEDYLQVQKFKDDSRYSSEAIDILERLDSVDLSFYEEYITKLEEEGIHFVPFFSDDYPRSLWRLEDPPLCLYIDGDLSSLSDGVAVVGTREAKKHRLEFVEEIAELLVSMDRTVVSGLANGVDAAAHRGALNAGGETVAVLPGDVKKITPASNKELGEQIPDHGALVSETSEKVNIHRGRFVERNRITSGISAAVVIGASGETGGTIHQAKFAQEQNKPRFLYTPDEDDGQSPTKVLDKGFHPFSTLQELEELLGKDFEEAISDTPSRTTFDDF